MNDLPSSNPTDKKPAPSTDKPSFSGGSSGDDSGKSNQPGFGRKPGPASFGPKPFSAPKTTFSGGIPPASGKPPMVDQKPSFPPKPASGLPKSPGGLGPGPAAVSEPKPFSKPAAGPLGSVSEETPGSTSQPQPGPTKGVPPNPLHQKPSVPFTGTGKPPAPGSAPGPASSTDPKPEGPAVSTSSFKGEKPIGTETAEFATPKTETPFIPKPAEVSSLNSASLGSKTSSSAPELTPPESGAPPLEAPSGVFRAEGKSPLSFFKKALPILLIILALVAGGWALYRFVWPSFKKTKEVELTYWGLWESKEVMEEILADWEKDHPGIKVSYQQHSPKEYRERLQSAFARGEGPDIFRFHNAWVPMLKNELAPVPASVMSAGEFEKTFYPVAVASLRSGTDYLGIPLEVDTLALFYNQDILTAAGASPPKTWDELRQLASQLTLRDNNGRIQRAGAALGTTGNIWHWSDILALMMLQNGADLSAPMDNLAEDALTFYTIFSKTDQVWDNTLPNSILAFATGKAAMVFGFSWDVFEIEHTNPSLNYKVVSVPQLPGSEVAWASFWVEGVAQKSQNQEAAWEFLKFLSSSETMEKLYQAESRLRLFGEPYSKIEMASILQSDPKVAPFVNQASKAKSWYLSSRTFDNGINDRIIYYYENAVNAVNAGSSPRSALQTAAAGVNQVLTDFGQVGYSP